MPEAKNPRQQLEILNKMSDLQIMADARIGKECTGANGVLDKEMAQRRKHTYILISGDWLNEILGVVMVLRSPNRKKLIEQIREESGSFKVKGFTERYCELELDTSGSNQDKIKKLDELATEANRLINEPFIDMTALINLAITATEVCEHPVMEEDFRKCLQEVLLSMPSLT